MYKLCKTRIKLRWFIFIKFVLRTEYWSLSALVLSWFILELKAFSSMATQSVTSFLWLNICCVAWQCCILLLSLAWGSVETKGSPVERFVCGLKMFGSSGSSLTSGLPLGLLLFYLYYFFPLSVGALKVALHTHQLWSTQTCLTTTFFTHFFTNKKKTTDWKRNRKTMSDSGNFPTTTTDINIIIKCDIKTLVGYVLMR